MTWYRGARFHRAVSAQTRRVTPGPATPSLTLQTRLLIFETADDCLVLMSQAQVPEGRTRGWEASRAPSGQPCWVCTAVGPQGGEAVAGLHATAEGPPGSPSPRVSADNDAGRELTRLRPH